MMRVAAMCEPSGCIAGTYRLYPSRHVSAQAYSSLRAQPLDRVFDLRPGGLDRAQVRAVPGQRKPRVPRGLYLRAVLVAQAQSHHHTALVDHLDAARADVINLGQERGPFGLHRLSRFLLGAHHPFLRVMPTRRRRRTSRSTGAQPTRKHSATWRCEPSLASRAARMHWRRSDKRQKAQRTRSRHGSRQVGGVWENSRLDPASD